MVINHSYNILEITIFCDSADKLTMFINRVSTTTGNTGNTGNLLDFETPTGNAGNVLEFYFVYWKILKVEIKK